MEREGEMWGTGRSTVAVEDVEAVDDHGDGGGRGKIENREKARVEDTNMLVKRDWGQACTCTLAKCHPWLGEDIRDLIVLAT